MASGMAWTISCRARTRSRSAALTTLPPPRWFAAIELAGHDESLMRDVHVLVGRGVQQPPVVRMDLDGLFQQRVDFVDAIEALQGR